MRDIPSFLICGARKGSLIALAFYPLFSHPSCLHFKEYLMQQVVVFYFQFLYLNVAGSEVSIGTVRTIPHLAFYKFSSRCGNNVPRVSTKAFSHLPEHRIVSKCVTFQDKLFSVSIATQRSFAFSSI